MAQDKDWNLAECFLAFSISHHWEGLSYTFLYLQIKHRSLGRKNLNLPLVSYDLVRYNLFSFYCSHTFIIYLSGKKKSTAQIPGSSQGKLLLQYFVAFSIQEFLINKLRVNWSTGRFYPTDSYAILCCWISLSAIQNLLFSGFPSRKEPYKWCYLPCLSKNFIVIIISLLKILPSVISGLPIQTLPHFPPPNHLKSFSTWKLFFHCKMFKDS